MTQFLNINFCQNTKTGFISGEITEQDHHAQLKNLVLISLFTDRRANDTDVLDDDDRRGWWADSFNNYKIGSRLWQLKRRKITAQLLVEIEKMIREALEWMITEKIIKKVEITVQRDGIHAVSANLDIFRNEGTTEKLSFNNLWDNLK